MDINEMRELPIVELESEIAKAREKAWKMGFQARGEPIESPSALRGLKKEVARMMTVLREKQLAGESKTAQTVPSDSAAGSVGGES